jgi:hypothetical protein
MALIRGSDIFTEPNPDPDTLANLPGFPGRFFGALAYHHLCTTPPRSIE